MKRILFALGAAAFLLSWAPQADAQGHGGQRMRSPHGGYPQARSGPPRGAYPQAYPRGMGGMRHAGPRDDIILDWRPHGRSVRDQIRAERQRERMERWRIMRETRTRVYEDMQDVTVNRARNADRARRAWERFMDE